jgi:two-component system sensor histidine kinase BaeS
MVLDIDLEQIMKIKAKLITAMTGIVVLMMGLFYFLVQVEFYIIRDLTYFSNKHEIDQIKNSLLQYYQKNHSWNGVDKQIKLPNDPFVLVDKVNHTKWKYGNQERSTIVGASFPVTLKIKNELVGILYYMTPEQYQAHLMKNVWNKYMYGVVGLASMLGIVITVVVIYLVSATLTKPIRMLIRKIKQFEDGEKHVDFHLKRKDEFKEIGDALASMKQKVEKAEQARKALVSDVAHELKTPLMVIQGELELLHIQQKPVSAAKYDSVSSEIKRMTTIIDDILHLSKAEAQQVPIHQENIAMDDFLGQLADKTKYLFEQYQAVLDYSKHTQRTITADKEKLMQIMYNLLQNAFIHGETTTRVTITVEQVDATVMITVSDDGIGIKMEDLPFVFERFYRGDESRNRKTGGTGIGLSIVKTYVEMLGGSVEVYSGEQKGTKFEMRFPTISG